MDIQSWRRVRELFDALADLRPEDWDQRLTDLGIEDPTLRAEVFALLKADRQSVLRTGVSAQAPDVLAQFATDDEEVQCQRLVGQLIGPFRLMRELGRGGMGTVWLAERDDGQFEQQVAVKLIRTGWDADGMLARFRGERQILAGLTHPNIARLIDGGVVDGDRPWLALEFIDGVELGEYCDRGRLSLAQRLRLFLTVCDAVSHAHARLVVHRDLKPSNLLVTSAGQVKLLDFGIAKLLGDNSVQATATQMFTPEYAAPEQIRGEAVTTAVDIYALGLLLYELLTGRHPFRVGSAQAAAYERAVLDQEPPRPSVTATRSDGRNDAEILAAQRSLTPQRLRHELRGDLDAIVLKALRKDPDQRYESVGEMSADIESYLASRPVAARKGGWRYHSQRFIRRHALAAGLASVAILALAGGLAAALWQANEARAQRDFARNESDKATQTVNFLLDVFRSVDPAATQGRKVTADELLERSVERIEDRHFDNASIHYDLLLAMGEAYLGIGNTTEARALFERTLALQDTAYPEDTLRRVRLLVLLSRSVGGDDRGDAAARYLDEAERLLPASAAGTELAADLNVSRGINLLNQGKAAEAIDHLVPGVAALQRLRGPTDSMTISAANILSWAYDGLDRHLDARAVLMPIVDALRAAPETNPARLADTLDALANTYVSGEEAEEASAMRREALEITRRVYGEDHPFVQIRLNNLASSLMQAHDYRGANEAMKEVLEHSRLSEPPGSNRIGSSLNNLASTEYALGRWAEAERLWNEAVAIRRNAGDSTDTAYSLTGSASAARELGRLGDARERIEEALALMRASDAPKPTHLARTLIEHAEIDLAHGRADCTHANEAVALMHANSAPDDARRLYIDVVAAGCAWRAEATHANRQRLLSALSALRAELPPDTARWRQAQRYAPDRS